MKGWLTEMPRRLKSQVQKWAGTQRGPHEQDHSQSHTSEQSEHWMLLSPRRGWGGGGGWGPDSDSLLSLLLLSLTPESESSE